MRAYHKLHPPQLSKSGLSEVAKSILEKPISVEVNFTADNLVIFTVVLVYYVTTCWTETT